MWLGKRELALSGAAARRRRRRAAWREGVEAGEEWACGFAWHEGVEGTNGQSGTERDRSLILVLQTERDVRGQGGGDCGDWASGGGADSAVGPSHRHHPGEVRRPLGAGHFLGPLSVSVCHDTPSLPLSICASVCLSNPLRFIALAPLPAATVLACRAAMESWGGSGCRRCMVLAELVALVCTV